MIGFNRSIRESAFKGLPATVATTALGFRFGRVNVNAHDNGISFSQSIHEIVRKFVLGFFAEVSRDLLVCELRDPCLQIARRFSSMNFLI